MERILVGVEPREGNLWAGIHALNLAKRINAKVSFLVIMDPERMDKEKGFAQRQQGGAIMDGLARLIEKGRADGVGVDYFVTQGEYEEEVIRFVKENRITMLVVGQSHDPKGASGQVADHLEKVRHRIDCRIEVVHEKSGVKPASGSRRKR